MAVVCPPAIPELKIFDALAESGSKENLRNSPDPGGVFRRLPLECEDTMGLGMG